MTMRDTKPLVAPYGAWKTMENAFERFAASGIPPRIDRTAFPGLEWNAATRLLGGLRFLGLIDDAGAPQVTLQSLTDTDDQNARKYALGRVLRERYAELFKLDLARVTSGHFADVLSEAYNVKGDTLEKAVRFFVSAAAYAGIGLSPLLLRERTRRTPGPITRRAPTPKPSRGSAFVPPAVTDGPMRVLRLTSGGVITLNAAVDFLTLSPEDRAFVFDLIDKLGAYEREHPPQGEEE